ncbi:MAG: NAD(P)/FAD-dependent oxidoreductase [Verrucomicrobia bacterium]|nr:NAD(P)/FAD-dependent oxidoreductase [Verrucomicrobiota bacterium]
MSAQYQVIVIGSGSAGKDAALQAARAGLRTLLIESGRIGGTGIHRGCHAVRTLRACATHYERVKGSDVLGVYPDLVATDWSSWLAVQSRVTNRLAAELSCALDDASVDVKFGRGEVFDARTVVITNDEGKESVTGQHIILATGSRPRFAGNEKVRVLNSDQVLQSSLTPKNLFVIGGGYIGCELAAIYRARGVEVTLVEAESRLLPDWDEDIGKRMQKVLEEAEVKVLLNEHVALPEGNFDQPPRFWLHNGTIVSPELTLVAVGRTPNVEGLHLEKVGLPSSGFIPVNAQMQTSVPNIFAIGDINGIMLLDSAAYAQARVAIQTILGHPARFDAHWIPRCLHTQPPIAAAGWTAAEANAAGHDVEIISSTLALITDDDATMIEPDKNLVKLIVQSSTDRILGCQAIGSRAAELINLISSAIRLGLSVQRLADLSFIHPSASEAMIRVVQDHFDRSPKAVLNEDESGGDGAAARSETPS